MAFFGNNAKIPEVITTLAECLLRPDGNKLALIIHPLVMVDTDNGKFTGSCILCLRQVFDVFCLQQNPFLFRKVRQTFNRKEKQKEFGRRDTKFGR